MLAIEKGVKKSAVKCVVYGVEGIGKTTFASHFPKPLFLDLDKGSQRMEVDRISPASWLDLMKVLEDICQEKDLPYSTIVIDTADMAAKMCTEYVCRINGDKKNIEEFGYGKGYVVLAQEFAMILIKAEMLIEAGYNVVFLAHAMQRTITKPDDTGSYDHWEMKLPGKGNNSLGGMLKEWADLLLFADYKVIIREGADGKGKAAGGQRKMRANHTAFADAKNRFGLPDMMDFDYKEIASIIPERVPPQKPSNRAPKKTKMEEAYQAKKDFQQGKEPVKESPKAVAPMSPVEELKARMQEGISDADKDPITEEELLKAIHTVEEDPQLQAAQKLEDLPEGYIRTLLAENQWSGLKMWMLNNIRIPF